MLLTLYAAASCYTHYYGVVSAAAVYLGLLVYLTKYDKDRVRYCWASGIMAILLFSPWLISCIHIFLSIKDGYFWIQSVGLNDIKQFLMNPFCYSLWATGTLAKVIRITMWAIILFFVYAICINGTSKRQDKNTTAYFAASSVGVYLFTVAVGCIVSWLTHPVFCARYAVQAIPLVYLTVVILLSGREHIKVPSILMVCIASLMLYCNLNCFGWQEGIGVQRWKEVSPVLHSIKRDDVIVVPGDYSYPEIFCGLTEGVRICGYYIGHEEPYWRRSLVTLFYDYEHIEDCHNIPDVKGDVYFAWPVDEKGDIVGVKTIEQEISDMPLKLLGDYYVEGVKMRFYLLSRAAPAIESAEGAQSGA